MEASFGCRSRPADAAEAARQTRQTCARCRRRRHHHGPPSVAERDGAGRGGALHLTRVNGLFP